MKKRFLAILFAVITLSALLLLTACKDKGKTDATETGDTIPVSMSPLPIRLPKRIRGMIPFLFRKLCLQP